jgi:dipeptidyl aminopeptidase/acylaminoacyl peptidase
VLAVVVVLVVAGCVGVGVVGASAIVPSPGEVVRVWLDGRRVNLSASSADDVFPVVSPDGRRVAFISDRGLGARSPFVRLFVVDSDGGRPQPWSSQLATQSTFLWAIAWSPDSTRLVVCDRDTVERGSRVFDRYSCYLVGPGRGQRLIARVNDRGEGNFVGDPVWSRDGSRIALAGGRYRRQEVLVVTPEGRQVLRLPGGPGVTAWSIRGDLAVFYRGAVRVYDRDGRVTARVPTAGFSSYAWSPEGDRLAVVRRTGVEVRSARGGGLLFRKPIAALRLRDLFDDPQVSWLDGDTLVVSGSPLESPQGVLVDLPDGRVYGRFGEGWLSPAATHLARVDSRGQTTTLTVSRRDGSDRRVLVRRTPCRDPIVGLEWLPDGQSLVYDFQCDLS